MNPVLESAYARITGRLPASIAGRIDWLRPSFRDSWGGPLNGQERRQEIVRELARTISFDRVIETGTYRGTSTEFFSAVFEVPIETVEADPRLFSYSSRRFSSMPRVTVTRGDSRAFLSSLAERSGTVRETVFIYLDAHWSHDLPLSQELQIIGRGWTRAVVMIDDFEVPGDDNYGFDDYGPGLTLTERNLPFQDLRGWHFFYPRAHSSEETGARRGCVVLSSAALAAQVREAVGLRQAD